MAEKLERELGKTLVADRCRVLCSLGVSLLLAQRFSPTEV
jgi:hypothetical protein